MSKRWKPENGVQYFLVDADGGIGYYRWEGDAVDRTLYEVGNCFKTKTEAKSAAKRFKSLLLSLHGEPAAKCTKLSKLTADVFDRQDCPVWANFAMVNCYNRCFFMERRPGQEVDGGYCYSSGMYKSMDEWEKFELGGLLH